VAGEKGKGPLTGNGIGQLVERRGMLVGLPGLHPHQFRHTFAHSWLAEAVVTGGDVLIGRIPRPKSQAFA